MMIRHKALHSRDDTERLYVSRKSRRWKRLGSTEACVDASIKGRKDYIKRGKKDQSLNPETTLVT